MAPGFFGGLRRFRGPGSRAQSDHAVIPQAPASTADTQPNVCIAAPIEAIRPPSIYADVPAPDTTQDAPPGSEGSLQSSTDIPVLTVVQNMGPHSTQGDVDTPIPACTGKVSLGQMQVDAGVVQASLTHGYHDIEDELVFQSNPGFVFHDSCGFEAANAVQFNKMNKFVMDCAKAFKLDERIHAIWFCIPWTDSEKMVTASEMKFFDECDTGYVPVIVLLTKTDALELEALEELEGQGSSVDDAERVADVQREILDTHTTKLKANVLNGEGLQQLLISTQQSNLGLCVEFAIVNLRYINDNSHMANITTVLKALHYICAWYNTRVT
ncbi:hypothetical protein F5J12DRAFT_784941 [Pisolithus orientalis]|uniref:uncharacterized protein n=1 Tax=Pisolithus orientalis TaxID=936130 RepID=UPI0022254A52|nr:uncharacterized protein F5J12DRAFT_784941 [Pisolithus orientalis]KAI5998359.1 hypothetical protein F5J12DRAFT_784941 [Pisolithus orientalis]